MQTTKQTLPPVAEQLVETDKASLLTSGTPALNCQGSPSYPILTLHDTVAGGLGLKVMTLQNPFIITSRLLPGLQIADGTIQLEYSKRDGRDGHTRYRWTIGIPAGEFTGEDLQSGCGGGTLQQGFESLLSFLSAAAESYPDGENADLFPPAVVEWAYQNSDELSMLACLVEEQKTLIEE